MTGQTSIAIESTSSSILWFPSKPMPTPAPPTMTVNGLNITPSTSPASPSGFQVVIFDTTQPVPSAASILLNEYICVLPYGSNQWSTSYDAMYGTIAKNLISYGDPENQLVLLASFGLDRNMVPDADMVMALNNYGAGTYLQAWVSAAYPGVGGNGNGIWVGRPASYILIGSPGAGAGNGDEMYMFFSPATLQVTL